MRASGSKRSAGPSQTLALASQKKSRRRDSFYVYNDRRVPIRKLNCSSRLTIALSPRSCQPHKFAHSREFFGLVHQSVRSVSTSWLRPVSR